jgi:phage gpG-like protein
MALNNRLFPQLEADRKKFEADVRQILILAGNLAVTHFEDNFQKQGFVDKSVDPWKPRKVVDSGRGILIGKGGGEKLSNSIARTLLGRTSITIGIKGNPNKYASVHNFGLRAGRGSGFIMPQRKFMGESEVLNKKIIRLINKRIKKIL